MKKNLFFFLLVPMISCAMEEAAPGEQPVPEGKPAKSTMPVALSKSLVMRLKKEEPTEMRKTEQGLKKIPSDGEFDLEKIATVQRKCSDSKLKIAAHAGEPKYDLK